MVFSNLLTEKLGIQYPIVQGPFGGGLSSVELLATVSNAGGLGSFGAHHLSPGEIADLVKDIKKATDKPFAINLWVSNRDYFIDGVSQNEFEDYCERFRPLYDAVGADMPDFTDEFSHDFEEQVDALIKAAPPAISFVYGVPGRHIIDACRDRNITTIGTATTFDEALLLQEAGLDAIVATGFEAGGHRVSFLKEPEQCLTGTLALVPQITDKLSIPVIAAGGIADVRGVRAAMALGAHGVQIGTAFLACEESGTSDMHREILMSNRSHSTVLSRAFTGRLARFIENEVTRYVEKSDELPVRFPIQSYFTGPIKNAANKQENSEFASLYAGQGAPLLKHTRALELFQSLSAAF